MWLSTLLLLVSATLSSGQGCGKFRQIAEGVILNQTFGETAKRIIEKSDNCTAACLAETDFVCTAFLSVQNGECVLLDKIDLNRQVMKDVSYYRLYNEACDGETPSIGYCPFEITRTNVKVSASSVSPGMTSPSGCRDFCVARYHNLNCTAFTVAPVDKVFSTCSLFQSVTSADVSDGSMDLWTTVCETTPVNCAYGSWNDWSSTCSTSCGGGTQTRSRSIASESSNGGTACDTSLLNETQTCSTNDCPTDCMYGKWEQWGTCSATCGGGIKMRGRAITSLPANGGTACSTSLLSETQVCSTNDCSKDWTYAIWGCLGACIVIAAVALWCAVDRSCRKHKTAVWPATVTCFIEDNRAPPEYPGPTKTISIASGRI
uniref:Apple domain-containing protein n=1 Tax=Plectus sambesii TaxID=2011161 RepID=A0A914UYB2_9BILA